MEKGLIFNIQKYSIHDGPGIRTTVFFKGCPLKCWWCHNPEGISLQKEIIISVDKCINCKNCLENCPENAIILKEGIPYIARDKCTKCGKCTEICPVNALEMAGKEVSTEDVIKEIEGERIFYEESGGGVTFSGGEPLLQFDFLQELLKECKRRDIHTAVDTSGYTDWSKLKIIAENVDLFLYDLKLMNNESHQKYTGIENKIILKNLRLLADTDCKIIVRIPIIPGINNHKINIYESGKFLKELSLREVNILPYHKIGAGKYNKLGMVCKMPEIDPPSEKEMEEIASILKNYDLNVKIGG